MKILPESLTIIDFEDMGIVDGHYQSKYLFSNGEKIVIRSDKNIIEIYSDPKVARLNEEIKALASYGISKESYIAFAERIFNET